MKKDREYNSGKYRVIPGWFGWPILQVWMTPPNSDYHRWERVKFKDCHTLLEGTEI